MDNPSEIEDLDKRFETLREKAGEFLETCRFGSAYRVYGEIRRLAKSENRVIHYILSLFHQMDLSLDLQEPNRAREMAIELIALLESEDQARQIQPDLPECDYEHVTGWMTACAYENLAEATGRMDGYNSEGMHTCITDGIQVCRRTGKLACIRCFREYATEVYTAADDLPMALHHSRSIATHPGPWSNRGNRRWFGSKNEAWLHLLTGQVEMAREALERAVRQTKEEEVSLPLQSRLRTAVDMEQLQLLTGVQNATAVKGDRGELVSDFRKERLPEEEYPANHLRWVLNDALAACCRQEYDLAIRLLQEQDRAIFAHRNLHEWFEVRLRLIAAHRLAGQEDKVAVLAKQLDQRARKARDWLTLRRMEQLLNPAEPPSPIASVRPLTTGLFAAATDSVHVPAPPPPAPAQEGQGEAAAEPPPSQPTPLDERIAGFHQRLDQAQDDETRQALLNDILATSQEQLTVLADAGRLIHLLTYLTGDGSRAEEIWTWAQKTAQLHPQSAPMLSFLALLGDILRTSPQTPKDLIPLEKIDHLFRQSLELDPDNPGNFARAGAFYLDIENLGEAERCLARGFRLQRDSSFLALRLADVYKKTERPRDALAVLDMCLRHGCEDPQVAWDAALTAMTVKQHDAQLTYLNRYEELAPDQPWTGYYKALAHLDLNQPQEALNDLDIEERRSPERPLGVQALRACALAALDQKEEFAQRLNAILSVPMHTIDYLSLAGVNNLFQRLWTASQCLPAENPLRATLNQRLLMMGLAPDDMIDQERMQGKAVSDVHFYRCIVEQPLDENWPKFPGCLAGQQDWTKYIMVWGVLARDEEEAGQIALQWQARCYPLPAQVVEIQPQEGTYHDRVGAVWQGERYGMQDQDS